MSKTVKVTISVDTSPLRRALDYAEARMAMRRVRSLRDRGHHRAAEVIKGAHTIKHGMPPAEHALRLRTDQILFDSPRWSPQP